MFFQTSAFSCFFTTHQPKQNTSTYHNFSKLQLKKYLEDPANIPYCCPGSSTTALLLPSTQFFQAHFKENPRNLQNTQVLLYSLSRVPTRTDHNCSRLTSRNIHATCKIHRCSCTAHPKPNKTQLLRTHLCHHQAAKTPPQTRTCLQSLPGIAKHTVQHSRSFWKHLFHQ